MPVATICPSVVETGKVEVLRRSTIKAKSESIGFVQERLIELLLATALNPLGEAGAVVSIMTLDVPAEE